MARRSAVGWPTDRDRNILQWVGQGGVATLDQLARRFWPSKGVDAALNRLRQLVKAGYLETHVCDSWCPGGTERRGERVFALTQQGFMQFNPSERQHFYVGLPPPAEIGQQILAQEAYLRLEMQAREQGAQLVGWKSERALRAELLRSHHHMLRPGARGEDLLQRDIPDAEVVILTASGERQILYVEVDGAYYGKMLWQKAGGLAKSGHPVIWVCTLSRADYIRKAVAEYPNIQVLSL